MSLYCHQAIMHVILSHINQLSGLNIDTVQVHHTRSYEVRTIWSAWTIHTQGPFSIVSQESHDNSGNGRTKGPFNDTGALK